MQEARDQARKVQSSLGVGCRQARERAALTGLKERASVTSQDLEAIDGYLGSVQGDFHQGSPGIVSTPVRNQWFGRGKVEMLGPI